MASRRYNSQKSTASAASASASPHVFPASTTIVAENSSRRSRMIAETLATSAARSATGTRDHVVNAFAAAATAASANSGVAVATRPTTRDGVVGSCDSSHAPVSTFSPPISIERDHVGPSSASTRANVCAKVARRAGSEKSERGSLANGGYSIKWAFRVRA